MITRESGIPIFLLCLVMVSSAQAKTQPNIIYIIADDMGWNDVSFHGSNQIPTPNIDALAYNGVILKNHYVQPTCTPSRSALMTGKYPIRLGMQGLPILAAEPRGLPEGKLLPEYLKDLGYTTHAVGKWHLGYHDVKYLPIYRGFDSHMGYWNGFVSYYDYIQETLTRMGGFDLRRNLTTAWDLAGRYATDLFTDHAVNLIQKHNKNQPLFLYFAHLAVHAGNAGKSLEAPQEVVNRFRYIRDPNRRTYAAMVAKLDESVGRVVQALQKRNMLENSIIVFTADNGAPTVGVYQNWGSNYPFRGIKATLWEGGVKGAALVWSPLLQNVPRVSNQLIHITDWLPTLYSAAGGNALELEKEMDGLNQWNSLAYNTNSRRNEILLNIDEVTKNSAYRQGHWKLITGTVKNNTLDDFFGDSGDAWYVPPYDVQAVVRSIAGRSIAALNGDGTTSAEAIPRLRKEATVYCLGKAVSNCKPKTGVYCLFDMENDPCERKDLSRSQPRVVKELRKKLLRFSQDLVPQTRLADDKGANPTCWNYTWTPWTTCRKYHYAFCNFERPKLDISCRYSVGK